MRFKLFKVLFFITLINSINFLSFKKVMNFIYLGVELVIRTLEIHQQTVHSNRIESNLKKTEKPKRPVVTSGMSEADWEFFQHRWTRYVRQVKLSGQGLMDELWATLDIDLERLAFHDSVKADTETQLLKEIKKIAVTVLHPSVHIVTLH